MKKVSTIIRVTKNNKRILNSVYDSGKKCELCENPILQPVTYSKTMKEKQKYCSRKCARVGVRIRLRNFEFTPLNRYARSLKK